VFYLAREVYDRATALAAATLLAVSPLFWFYGAVGLTYAGEALCAVTVAYFAFRALKGSETDSWLAADISAWRVDCASHLHRAYVLALRIHASRHDGRTWAAPEEQARVSGTFNTLPFNKEALAKHLAPCVISSSLTGRGIFVGEFSSCAGRPARRNISRMKPRSSRIWLGLGLSCVPRRKRLEFGKCQPAIPTGGSDPDPTDRLQVIQGWFGKKRISPEPRQA